MLKKLFLLEQGLKMARFHCQRKFYPTYLGPFSVSAIPQTFYKMISFYLRNESWIILLYGIIESVTVIHWDLFWNLSSILLSLWLPNGATLTYSSVNFLNIILGTPESCNCCCFLWHGNAKTKSSESVFRTGICWVVQRNQGVWERSLRKYD